MVGMMYCGDDAWWGRSMVRMMYGEMMYGGDDVWWGLYMVG